MMYAELAAAVRGQIAAGGYGPGGAIESEAELGRSDTDDQRRGGRARRRPAARRAGRLTAAGLPAHHPRPHGETGARLRPPLPRPPYGVRGRVPAAGGWLGLGAIGPARASVQRV